MTEKRFTFEIKTQGNKAYTQWYDNKNPINSAETLCGLLNELHEENKELRLLVDTFKEQNMKFKLRLKDLGVEYL